MDVGMDLPGYKKWRMYWKMLLFDNSHKREVQDIHLNIYIFEIPASPEYATQSTFFNNQTIRRHGAAGWKQQKLWNWILARVEIYVGAR